MTDREAVALAQAGDERGFTALYERHQQKVYAICRRMVKSHEDAEDLRQETFAKAFEKIQHFRGDAQFGTWIYRIAVNMVLMQFRKTGLHTLSLDYEPEWAEGTEWREALVREDEQLNTVAERINLARAIAQLPLGYREIFLLHDVYGLGHREIAKMLHCSIGNSKSQLSKGRKSLQGICLSDGAIKGRIHRTRAALREKL